MMVGFRGWMTAVGVFIVLLTIAVMILYAVPVAGERLEGYDLDRLAAQSIITADSVTESEGRDLERALALAANTDNREAMFVDPDGRVAERAGPELLGDDPEVFREAAEGGRMLEEIDGLEVAVTPIFYGGEQRGGVVLATGGTADGVFGFFLRSVVEAAMVASVLAGGLALLLATLLGRRVERISSGARAIERGDLSQRIEPGLRDELGGLAMGFNAMAERLQGSFSRLEERVRERTGELEAERARLEAVLRQMPSAVAIAQAPSGEVVLYNERAREIRGGDVPRAVGTFEENKNWAFRLDGTPYEPEEWPLARSIRTGEEIVGEEIVLPRDDGTRATVSVNSAPIRDREGRIVAGVVVFSDITERKRAEEEVRRLALRNESILKSAGEGIFGLDPEGKAAFVNPAAAGMLGYEPEELLGRRPHDLVHHSRPDGSPYPAEECPVYAASHEGETRRVDGEVFWRKDGTSFPVEYVSTPVKEGGRITGTVVVFGDVTERREAEEEIRRLNEDLEERVRERTAELERERQKLDAVLNNLSEGVMAVDADGRVIFANPAAGAMLGEAGGRPPEGVPNPWADFDLPRAVARSSKEGESIVARVGGERDALTVRLEPLFGLEGGRSGALVVARDLSEGRRLEAEQQRFLANAAHELKTPLTAILGAAEILREDDEDPEIRHRFLGSNHSEAERMYRLSETMLKLARTGTDLREPNLGTVDLGAVARRATESMETLAKRAGLAVSVEGNGGRAFADEDWLEEALLVLLSNAIKHSERGGRVRVRAGGRALAVEDEGRGIPEENLPHVFERFYRGGGSGGFGLGLPICKELVERMGGEIRIESEEGKGTRVEIVLPPSDPE